MPQKQTERLKVDLTPSGRAVVHGRPSSYNNHRCRCDDCTEAWSKYINDKGYVKKFRKKNKKGHVRINL